MLNFSMILSYLINLKDYMSTYQQIFNVEVSKEWNQNVSSLR